VRRRPIDGQEQYVVVLQAATGERLPIWIGPSESIALAVRLTHTPTPRPLTYETMASLLAAVDGRITEILITKVEDGVFYADAAVEGAGGSARVDLRPSDALNLALVTGAPIRASAQALTAGLQTERADVTRLKDFPETTPHPSRQSFADSGRCSSGTPRIPTRSRPTIPPKPCGTQSRSQSSGEADSVTTQRGTDRHDAAMISRPGSPSCRAPAGLQLA
jgi:uncharacterized protein